MSLYTRIKNNKKLSKCYNYGSHGYLKIILLTNKNVKLIKFIYFIKTKIICIG